jgi:uncharacterized protein YidB (DUF937 family)
MGLFDELMGEVAGAAGGPAAGGDHAAMTQALLGMLGEQGSGGLESLVSGFHAGGLGDLMSSWVGTGPNQPATGAQIEQGLGGGVLDQLAQRAGLSKQAALSVLAVVLPLVVNKLTPRGQLPAGHELGGLLGGLLGGGGGGLLGGLLGGR